jgi:hypothetical protein
VTAAALVNDRVEAEDERELSEVIGRYGRLDLLCLDELGHLHVDRLIFRAHILETGPGLNWRARPSRRRR